MVRFIGSLFFGKTSTPAPATSTRHLTLSEFEVWRRERLEGRFIGIDRLVRVDVIRAYSLEQADRDARLCHGTTAYAVGRIVESD